MNEKKARGDDFFDQYDGEIRVKRQRKPLIVGYPFLSCRAARRGLTALWSFLDEVCGLLSYKRGMGWR
jgi:hypothetical protein